MVSSLNKLLSPYIYNVISGVARGLLVGSFAPSLFRAAPMLYNVFLPIINSVMYLANTDHTNLINHRSRSVHPLLMYLEAPLSDIMLCGLHAQMHRAIINALPMQLNPPNLLTIVLFLTNGIFFTVPAVPSSPPISPVGEVLSPNAVSITWQPPIPEGQNGIITSYTVLLTELPTNTTFTYQRNGSHTETVITGLHPHYDYRYAVAAATSVGLGPFSAPLILTTQQDGELLYNGI